MALLHVTVIALESVIQVPRAAMLDVRQDLPPCRRIACRCVGGHPHGRATGPVHGPLEEGLGCCRIAVLGEERVNDLAVLIDRPINVGSANLEAHMCFISPPLSTNWSSVCTSRCRSLQQEALDPPIDGAALEDEAALGNPFDDIGGA